MSWNIEIPTIVRTLINDVDGTNQTYSDERISQTVVVAAKYVQFDIELPNKYNIDISNITITPDPTALNDDTFIVLVAMKTACIFDESSLRTKSAMEGIRASLGPASLSVGGSVAGLKMLLDSGPCATYAAHTYAWNIQEATAIRAILSPFVGNNFDPSYSLNTIPRSRTFYS